jgi:hypothetical protein
MKPSPTLSTLLALGLLTPVLAFPAPANELADPAAMCAANPDCEVIATDGSGTKRFKILRGNGFVLVLCDKTRECRRLYPRGASAPVQDINLLFAAK